LRSWCFATSWRSSSGRVSRPQFQPRDRVLLTAASRFLPKARWSSFIVRPETLLKWHRHVVTRQAARWGSQCRGRRPIPPEVKKLIVRLVNDNPRWGYKRIRGELLKLGHDVSAMTIRNILRRHGLGPAPRRSGPTWTEFLRTQADSILASDFFTVYSLWGKTLYVLFFIELSSRRVHVAGCIARPDSVWVTQQARNLSMCLEDRVTPCDSSFTTATPSTAVASIASFELKASISFAPRSWHRAPTPSQSDG
jgi:putative transposase